MIFCWCFFGCVASPRLSGIIPVTWHVHFSVTIFSFLNAIAVSSNHGITFFLGPGPLYGLRSYSVSLPVITNPCPPSGPFFHHRCVHTMFKVPFRPLFRNLSPYHCFDLSQLVVLFNPPRHMSRQPFMNVYYVRSSTHPPSPSLDLSVFFRSTLWRSLISCIGELFCRPRLPRCYPLMWHTYLSGYTCLRSLRSASFILIFAPSILFALP